MKKLLPLLLVFSLFTFTSCEDLLECALIARSPKLPNKTFKVGVVNDHYHDSFDAEIKNEPFDDDYFYYFDIEGDLPDGIHVYFNHRTVTIEGVTENAGTYNFTIYLDVDPPINYDEYSGEYEETMCSTSAFKNYSLTINYQ
nr:hypothetical protein [uncultured Psychroserpens sp.]